jgi:serine/threonine protein kinase
VKEPSLEILVAEFIERREGGEPLDAETFARAHPQVASELRAALARLAETESLFAGAATGTPGRLGPYLLQDQIGRGGMARVFRAIDERRPGLALAVKLLDAPYLQQPRALERFRREAEALRNLRHEHIVTVHEIGLDAGTPYLVMDLVEGQSLEQILADARDEQQRKPWPAPQDQRRAARLVAQLSLAVATAHEQGLFHRDLKPSNVMVNSAGNPVLLDFGLVAMTGEETLTQSGDLLGTPYYMAPEQARGDSADARTDVYGLGALLYELLTLSRPRAGIEPVRLLEMARTRPLRRMRGSTSSIAPELQTIVYRATAFAPRRRYQNARSLAQDLEAFLAGKVLHASPATTTERLVDLCRNHRRSFAVVTLGVGLACCLWLATQLLDRPPFHAFPHLQQATTDWFDERPERAASQLELILDKQPDHEVARFLSALVQGEAPQPSSDPLVQLLDRGVQAQKAGNHAAAAAAFDEAVQLKPQLGLPAVLLADSLTRLPDPARTHAELQAAARLLPESAALQRHLGLTYYAEERYDQAREAFERAALLRPDHFLTWSELARTCCRTGAIDRGLEASKQALALGGDQTTEFLDALNAQGCLLDADQRYEEAEQVFRLILEYLPSSHRSRKNLALNLDRQHRSLEALEECETMLRMDPENTDALVTVAWKYSGARAKDPTDPCEECIQFYADNPDLLDPDQAIEAACAALKIDRGSSWQILGTIVRIAQNLEEQELFREELEDLLLSEDQDARVLNLTRAMRLLRN